MKTILNLASLLLLFLSYSVTAHNESDKAKIFTQMKSLVGTWVKEGVTNSNFEIQFELVAKDSTLVETWISKGKKRSLTLYHLNGENLMATHYCPQGNQPRLHLSNNSTINNMFFTYLDSTNLESLEDSHQHSLGFDFTDFPFKIRRQESYLSKSGEAPSELILVKNQ
jgi:hypothetical protein